ncbi:helix-turn-helix domain-containing protein [Weissella bombi]|uniref:helix-turn-helix domain-containing protein n=1 Tax=Weissella bombi TaxID=1505725 RepID=UPI003AF22188
MSGRYTLAQLRAGMRWSQKETATALDISTSSWNKWETGKSFPTQPNIDKILHVFNVKYDDVIF